MSDHIDPTVVLQVIMEAHVQQNSVESADALAVALENYIKEKYYAD